MLLQEAIDILDVVLNTKYANDQKVVTHGDYNKESLTSVSILRQYTGKLNKTLQWFVYFNFGYVKTRSKYDTSVKIKLMVNDEDKRNKILNADYLYQDHLNIDSIEPDIGI